MQDRKAKSKTASSLANKKVNEKINSTNLSKAEPSKRALKKNKKTEKKVISFEQKKIIALQQEIQDYRNQYAELFSNAKASKTDFDQLQRLNGILSQQARLTRLDRFVQWFTTTYQPAKAQLIIRAHRINKMSSRYIKYCPQLDFWDESLKALFDIEGISFAPLAKPQAKKLLGSDIYQSAGIIPFRVNRCYLNHRLPANGLKNQRAIKAWLIFADKNKRFLPDSSQALDFLKSMQITLNQSFQS